MKMFYLLICSLYEIISLLHGCVTQRELGVSWDVDLYGELLKIGGGKER